MACGKPPNPSSVSAPSPLRHPSPQSPTGALKELESVLRTSRAGPTIDNALSKTQFYLDRARRDGTDPETLRRLEATYEKLKGLAHERVRQQQQFVYSLNPFRKVQSYASEYNIGFAKAAIGSPGHWASPDYRRNLDGIVAGSTRIPQLMKDQLYSDVVRVIEISPHGGGLVKALTNRGQSRATGSLAKLGNAGNAGLGTAYELMGTAALSYSPSTPVNREAGASSLFIEPGRHEVTFGDKIYLDRRLYDDQGRRQQIECDIRIYDPKDQREVGVDFKHTQGTKHCSKYDRRQIEGVVQALIENHIDEYHFVTNGKFGDRFMEAIDSANKALSDAGRAPIGCHQYVHTLPGVGPA